MNSQFFYNVKTRRIKAILFGEAYGSRFTAFLNFFYLLREDIFDLIYQFLKHCLIIINCRQLRKITVFIQPLSSYLKFLHHCYYLKLTFLTRQKKQLNPAISVTVK